MSQLSGLQQLGYIDLWKLYDNAVCKANNGLPLEPWLSDAFQTLAAANDFRVNVKYGDVNKAKLVAGALLFDIQKQIRKKITGSKNEAYIYACDDAHMSSLLTLLNASSHLDQIPFASVLALELSQDAAGLHYVTLRMQSNTTSVPITLVPLNISTCGQQCALGNFFDIASTNMISTSLRDACAVVDSSNLPTLSPIGDGSGGLIVNYPNNNNPCLYPPGTNGTIYPYPLSIRKGFSKLEIALIATCSVLAAIILALLIVLGLVCYRNKLRKASF